MGARSFFYFVHSRGASHPLGARGMLLLCVRVSERATRCCFLCTRIFNRSPACVVLSLSHSHRQTQCNKRPEGGLCRRPPVRPSRPAPTKAAAAVAARVSDGRPSWIHRPESSLKECARRQQQQQAHCVNHLLLMA